MSWRVRSFAFSNLAESDLARLKLDVWVAENSHRFQIVPILVNNAWAVQYRPWR